MQISRVRDVTIGISYVNISHANKAPGHVRYRNTDV